MALKNGQGCQPLEVGQLVDLDEISVIDPGAGRVEVRADAGVGQFYGGKFGFEDIQVSEAISKPILVVKLTGGNFKQCTTSNRSLAAKGRAGPAALGQGQRAVPHTWPLLVAPSAARAGSPRTSATAPARGCSSVSCRSSTSSPSRPWLSKRARATSPRLGR